MNQCYKPKPLNRIQEGADEYLWKDISNRSIQDHFIAGAEWMQDKMIEKAAEWFEKYLFDIGYPDDWCRDSKNLISGRDKFIKAMNK